jgi:hypothetical protein
VPGGLVVPGTPESQPGVAFVPARARLQSAANIASTAAVKASAAGVSAAKSLVTKAIAVDQRQRIALDDPSTWLSPMRGPLIAMALAVVITIVAVLANKFAGLQVSVTWVSGPLFVAAIGFAVYRWIMIQKQ